MKDSDQTLTGNTSRALALWEIVSVTSSVLITLWAVQVLARHQYWVGAITVGLALVLMLFSHRVRSETARDLGFRFDNFLPALRLLLLPTIVAMGVIIIAKWWYDGQLAATTFRPRLLFVPAWALFQQYALQGFVNRRAQLLLGANLGSAAVTALVFCILHLPSPLLSVLALVGAFVWSLIYQRHPNLFAVSVSHAVVSLTLSMFLPLELLPLLRFGFKYFAICLF